MTTKKPRVRIVRGLRLVSTLPGFWKLESDPGVLFQFMGKVRIGPTGARYSIDRWLAPGGDVVSSLDTAVKRYLAKTAPSHATMKSERVEGLQIPPASRSELNRFWRAHPALRKGCLRKYGFDPIDEEEAYWRYGLAEPDHLSLLRAVQQNNGIFSLALVKRWEVEELKHANEPTRNP